MAPQSHPGHTRGARRSWKQNLRGSPLTLISIVGSARKCVRTCGFEKNARHTLDLWKLRIRKGKNKKCKVLLVCHAALGAFRPKVLQLLQALVKV